MASELEAGIHRMINTVQMRFDLTRIDRDACEQFVRTARKGSSEEANKVFTLSPRLFTSRRRMYVDCGIVPARLAR